MTDKSRILILSSGYLPHIGGSEIAIKNITDRLPDFEFDLITARLDKNTPEYERLGNVSVFRVGTALSLAVLLLPKNLFPLDVFLRAKKLLTNNKYIAVHAYQASGAAGAGWLLKYFYPKLPFIITLQEGKNLAEQSFLINFFRRLIIRKTDQATAISKYLRDYLLKIRKNLKVEVIPNGVDIDNFSRQFSYGETTALEESLNIQPDDEVIISVSRLVPKNGLDLLAQAMVFVKKISPHKNFKLIIAGEGDQEKELRGLVSRLGLEKNIIFTGSISQEDLPLYLKISDVFVRPSRSEGLGVAFLEAMASGIPIIGPRVGGIPDFLKDKETGLFCSLDPEDIAVKISMILEDEELRNKIIENSKRLIKDQYDWNMISEKFRRLYNNLS